MQRAGGSIGGDLQAGDLAQHVLKHRILARGELLFGDDIGGDGGLLGGGFGTVGRDDDGIDGPAIASVTLASEAR